MNDEIKDLPPIFKNRDAALDFFKGIYKINEDVTLDEAFDNWLEDNNVLLEEEELEALDVKRDYESDLI